MDRTTRIAVAWAAAGLAFLLIWGSLSGSGTGPMGLGLMHGAFWLVVFLIVLTILLVLVRPTREARRPPPAEIPKDKQP